MARLCLLLLAAAGAAALLTCNDYPLQHLQHRVTIQRSDIFTQGRRTAIDVLWVVDNSSSMCEEQASLTSHFDTFIDGLAGLDASFHIAVVATEVDPARPQVAGRFRYEPARINSQHCVSYVACTRDEHCGVGGCLCGVPWLRRCAADQGCEAGEACVGYDLPAGGASALRHCSPACADDGDCQDVAASRRTSYCDGGRCRVRACLGDVECPAGQVCLPSGPDDGALSFCRRFRDPGIVCNRPGELGAPCPVDSRCGADGRCEPVGFCPPQTCDCPTSLDPVIEFGPDAAGGEPDFEALRHHFRCVALLGTDGSSYEKGLEAAERALTPPLAAAGGPNDGFLRDDAYLVVVFLSDENDCSDRGPACTTREDCPDSENAACRQDPVERDRSFCRLPEREAQECEYWSGRLADVPHLASRFKDLKLGPDDVVGPACSADEDCGAGLYCSATHRKCARHTGRVIVAGIVGDRDTFCTTACPTADGQLCEASNGCVDPCPGGEFCAERFYRQGGPRVEPTCLDPTFGSAYSGRRYHEFVEHFSDRGITRSICRGRIDEALARIAGLVADVIPDTFCLAWPLPSCSTDSECRGDAQCVHDPGTLAGGRPFCARVVQGVDGTSYYGPTDLVIEIRSQSDGTTRAMPPEQWRFLPAEYGGCVEFLGAGPGPQEALFLRYITPLDPNVDIHP